MRLPSNFLSARGPGKAAADPIALTATGALRGATVAKPESWLA